MYMRHALPIAALAVALSAPAAHAAISVIGGGPARLCYDGAEMHLQPGDYLMYCDQALAGFLSSGDRAATLVNRGVIKMDLREYNSAADDFQAGLAIDANLGEAYVDLGATEIANKRFADAIAHIDKGLGLGTKRPENAYFDRAIANEMLGNLRAAYDDYRQALTLAPDFTQASDQLKRFKVVEKPAGT